MLKLFPKLPGSCFKEVNLDSEAKEWLARQKSKFSTVSRSPLLDPEICQAFIDSVHAKYGVDYSYGGYLEDRGTLWRGSYLEDGQKYMHVGVDYNVPADTQVSIDFDADVLIVDDDHDLEGGWGPRLILKPNTLSQIQYVMILGHLKSVLVTKGDRVKKGEVFANVGAPPNNGNWYPHLHVQAMELREFYNILENGIYQLDGYGRSEEIERLRSMYPNPEDVFV